jgi:hypothetical protein
MSISDVQVSEADAPIPPFTNPTAEFIVSLNFNAPTNIFVDYVTTAGSATEDFDYVGNQGQLFIPLGGNSGSIFIEITNDAESEPPEDFSVDLSNASGAFITDGVGTAIITSDE